MIQCPRLTKRVGDFTLKIPTPAQLTENRCSIIKLLIEISDDGRTFRPRAATSEMNMHFPHR